MEKYYPVIILFTLFLALIIAQLIKQDFNRAGMSALIMAIACGILFALSLMTDTITSWMLMSIFIIIIVLFSVARSDVLHIYTPEPINMKACPKPSGSIDESESDSGSGSGSGPGVQQECKKPVEKVKNTNRTCIDPCEECGDCITSCECYEAFKDAPNNFYGTA
jgi:hypothetical protein